MYQMKKDILEKWKVFMTLRDASLKALEEARNSKLIGKSFEAKLTFYPGRRNERIFN